LSAKDSEDLSRPTRLLIGNADTLDLLVIERIFSKKDHEFVQW